MPDYEIVKYPNPVLKIKTSNIEHIDDSIRSLLIDMVSVMHKNSGIGLAAPQIGISLRLCVVNAGDGILKMVNPEIIDKTGYHSMEEGCLSCSTKTVAVKRADQIKVRYLDENSNKVVKTCTGLLAKAIQHEVDHLNGRIILDYMPIYKKFLLNIKK